MLGACIVTALLAMLAGLAFAQGPNEQNIVVSPTSYSFGSVCIGASSPKTIRIDNTADVENGMDLHVSSITRSGSTEFVYTNPAPVLIAPQNHVNFTITFKPLSRGSRNADFTINSNDPDNPQEHVLVSGTGRERKLAANRPSVTFGEQRVGTRSGSQNLTLSNTGQDPVTVTSVKRIGAHGGDFRATPPAASFNIAPGGTAAVALAFQPTAAGRRSGGLEILYSNQWCPVAKLVVGLIGNGVVSNVGVAPNPVELGSTPVGKESKPVTVTLSNDGRAPLQITAIQVIGTDAADFSLQGLPVMPVTVLPAGIVEFQVRMTPSSQGLRSATLNVLSDDPDAPAFAVPIRGTASAATATPSVRPSTVTPSALPTLRATPSGSASSQALAKPGNDSLAVAMVVGGVVVLFGGLLLIRRLVGARDDDY